MNRYSRSDFFAVIVGTLICAFLLAYVFLGVVIYEPVMRELRTEMVDKRMANHVEAVVSRVEPVMRDWNPRTSNLEIKFTCTLYGIVTEVRKTPVTHVLIEPKGKSDGS